MEPGAEPSIGSLISIRLVNRTSDLVCVFLGLGSWGVVENRIPGLWVWDVSSQSLNWWGSFHIEGWKLVSAAPGCDRLEA